MENADEILSETRKFLRESKSVNKSIQEVTESVDTNTPITSRDISTNETDVKEAMVMVFYDCIRTDPSFMTIYENLVKTPTKEDISNLKKVLNSSKGQGSDYGIDSSGISNLHKLIVQVLSSKIKNKTDKSFRLVNNGVSAANAITTDPKIAPYLNSKSYATRGAKFNEIRNTAVKLFKNIKVALVSPDNWCPGDFYVMGSNSVPTIENIVELNSNFAGPSYPGGNITAISLKMETAQAGKGTTFLNTVLVLSVSEIDKKKTIPTNESSRNGLKYVSAKRSIYKYAIGDTPLEVDKVNGKLSLPFKMVYTNTPKSQQDKIPTIKKWYDVPRKEQKKFIEENYKKMGKESEPLFDILNKKLLGQSQTKSYVEGFKQAYSEFVKYIQGMGIKIKSDGADNFVKNIMKGKASKKQSGVQNVLIKKAECYTRAIELIEKWSDKNKEIANPFKKLGTIDNPLLAITMFAIAQHGANPDFFKVHGSDSGLFGTVELFPAKSKVDKTSIVQSLTIKDSEDAAGFYVSYNMKLNNVMYKTTLAFRFSDSSFRVEVKELEEAK